MKDELIEKMKRFSIKLADKYSGMVKPEDFTDVYILFAAGAASSFMQSALEHPENEHSPEDLFYQMNRKFFNILLNVCGEGGIEIDLAAILGSRRPIHVEGLDKL